jgi:adenylate cyclase
MSTFAELKRRNIFRVALLYLVAGWLILQLSAALFHHLGIPDWAFRFTFALLLICFPLVMVFSWIFEITPEGLKHGRKIEVQASITRQTGQRVTRITMILMALAILTFIIDKAIP